MELDCRVVDCRLRHAVRKHGQRKLAHTTDAAEGRGDDEEFRGRRSTQKSMRGLIQEYGGEGVDLEML